MICTRNGSRLFRLLPGLLLALLLCLPAALALGETRTVWNYLIEVSDDNTATIVDYRGADEELIIPAELDGVPVVAIGDGVFNLKQMITSVVIPEGVVSIGSRAFSSCDGIKSMTLPRSLSGELSGLIRSLQLFTLDP